MIIPPGYAAFSIRLTHAGFPRSSYITGGVKNDSAITNPDTLAGSIFTNFVVSTGLRASLDSEVVMGPTTVLLGQDGAESLAGLSASTASGLAVGNVVPVNVAVLFHKRTARGGRRGRGRLFWPWALGESNVDEVGTITASGVTAYNTQAAATLSALTANTTPLVLLHSVGDSAPGTPDIVTSMVVDPLVSTQRRRLGR